MSAAPLLIPQHSGVKVERQVQQNQFYQAWRKQKIPSIVFRMLQRVLF